MRTRKHRVPIHIKFFKPVYGFNSSTISVSGGHLQSFHGITQSLYYLDIYADDNIISVNVPENITMDIAGNGNLASNVLQVKHYTVPTISFALSTFANAAFAATSLAAVMLTISTASLQSIGGSSRRSFFMSGPARNLFRIACHMQVFALSRWLVVNLPVEYYEFSRGLEWTIPHLNLPWETGHVPTNVADSTPSAMAQSKVLKRHESGSFKRVTLGHQNSEMATTFLLGLPLTPMEYKSYFESQNIKPEAEHIFGSHNSNGWRMFNQNMFWLAVIGGGLLLLHALVLLILKFRRKSSEEWRNYGAVVLPRFEIFLLILALPCVCQASAALIKGGATTGTIVGILVLGVPSFLLLALLLFLSIGITMGKLLQYKEVHQEGEKFHWYQVIVRVTLGPGKRGQWTWKNQPNSVYLTMFGPLFEDLRGPPKYMLLEFSGGNPRKHGDQIIASDDENEDAEAPLIQKIFGILRIYYTLLELVKRVSLGVVAGAYTSSESSTTPSLMLLCITSFQLFFLVLKKPFIKKKVQLVEIVSVTSEVGIFVICLLLSKKEFFFKDEMKVGILMLLLFLVAFIVQMINEWYALYKQILQLDPAEKHFSSGLKTASIGLLLILIPQNMVKKLELNLYRSPETRETGISTGRYRSSGSRSSGTPDKPWLRQLRELAKASFSKDDTEGPTDPSSSQTRKSGFWSTMRSESGVKRSGGPSLTSSTDFKSRPKALYRDLESIFSSK
ncbi:hypothetical protein GIB67_014040 [Kingdonia uniflora]|uniref:Uncharacterized protein n=1 Tax=Kingdonia uniflora TaxID=39325 RepID=A0A7J7KX91_9MAGN|nr:hypothetical protein GIB67_014040 [Kingdonia uniflora]